MKLCWIVAAPVAALFVALIVTATLVVWPAANAYNAIRYRSWRWLVVGPLHYLS